MVLVLSFLLELKILFKTEEKLFCLNKFEYNKKIG